MNAEKQHAGRSLVDGRGEADSLGLYLGEIDATPLLSAEEEAQVARRAQAGDEEAAARLVCSNLRFVVSVAKKFQNRGVDFDDLIAEGNVGLLTAARKFDPEQGVRFISYAVWWIRQAILKALAEQSRLVRLPLNRATDLAGLHRASSRLLQRLEREATEDELAEETGLSVDIVRGLYGLSLADTRLDDDTDENARRTPELADQGQDPLRQLLQTESTEAIARALDRLSPRQARILRLRFGLGGERERANEEIARMLGVTRERVRQIVVQACAQLAADRELAAAVEREAAAVPVRRPRVQSRTRSRKRQAAAYHTGGESRRQVSHFCRFSSRFPSFWVTVFGVASKHPKDMKWWLHWARGLATRLLGGNSAQQQT
jgi:RNA polymerase primary sigma factor